MCLVGILYRVHPDYPLIIAANRDEFYARPTTRADWWEDQPEILGGRDLQAGGTWLGIHRNGRFGCVTNYRDLRQPLKPDAPSRGELVPTFLQGEQSAEAYLQELDQHATAYNGFNLLLWDGEQLCHYANEERQVNVIPSGVHALSNHLLNTPWPKVERLKAGLITLAEQGQAHEPEALFDCLDHREVAPLEALPDTGISKEWEEKLSAMHIVDDKYGTRVATVLRMDQQGEVHFEEKGFVPEGPPKVYSLSTR